MKRGGITLVLLMALASLVRIGLPLQGGPAAASKEYAAIAHAGGPTGAAEQKSAPLFGILSSESASGLAAAVSGFWGTENNPFQTGAKSCSDIRFVVALVPDPVHTHLGLFYDRTIEAIQESAEQNGYDFDRAWTPWDFKVHPEPDDFVKRAAEARNTLQREEVPGLLLFREGAKRIKARPDASCAQPLFVFLTSETPTGGINKKQFENGLAVVRWMRSQERLPEKRSLGNFPLLILGPTFSGSLYSLKSEIADALQNGKANPWEYIAVYSGTVTDSDSRRWFVDAFQADPRVHFAAFQYDDAAGLKQFLQYAEQNERKLINDGRDVVIVSEEGTAYGNSPGPKGIPARKPNVEDVDMVRTIYFPREISQFRSAYQGIKDTGATPGGTSNTGPTRPLLPMDLGTTGSGDDVDLAAPLQTPRSQESVMMGIVALLNQLKPKFVILRATDPLDEEFLARYLTNSYTRGRIVVLPVDLLLGREGDGLLQGVLAIAPYVLNPEREDVSLSGSFIFPSSLSATTFQAMGKLLCVADTDCTQNPRDAAVLTGTPGTSGLVPPLKLSILGRYGYSCLGLLGAETSGESSPYDNPWSAKPSFSWDVAYGACLLIAVFQLFASAKGRVFSRLQSVAIFNSLPSRKRVFLIGIGSLLLLGAFVLLMDARSLVRQAQAVPLAEAATFLLWAPVLLLAGVTAWEIGWRRKEWTVGIGYCIAALGVFGLGMYNAGVWEAGCLGSWRLRVLDLASGVSPLLPALVLLAGGYWWVWHSLQGEVVLGERRPKLPDIRNYAGKTAHRFNNDPEAAAKASRQQKLSRPDEEQAVRVCRAGTIFGEWQQVWAPVGAIAVLVFTVLYTVRLLPPVETVEGRYFDWSYSILFALLSALYIVCLMRIVRVWVACHTITEGLDRTGLREAFIQIKGFSWDLMWNPASNAFEQGRRILSRQVEDLGRLKNLLAKASIPEVEIGNYDALDECRKEIDEALKEAGALAEEYAGILARSGIKKTEREEDCLLIEAVKKMQIQLATTADMIFLDLLVPVWRHETTPALTVAGDSDKKVEGAENMDPRPWRRVAEEFVALVYVSFLMKAVLQIRTLVMSVSGLFISILIATNVYPFAPKSGLQSLIVGFFLAAAGAITYVYVEMHRDATLSRLTRDEDGGDLGLDFWRKIISGGAIPLIGLLASQFPFISNILFSWLQPALQALK